MMKISKNFWGTHRRFSDKIPAGVCERIHERILEKNLKKKGKEISRGVSKWFLMKF